MVFCVVRIVGLWVEKFEPRPFGYYAGLLLVVVL
jgi:hypothetical protein